MVRESGTKTLKAFPETVSREIIRARRLSRVGVLTVLRGSGESLSDVILRLVEIEA